MCRLFWSHAKNSTLLGGTLGENAAWCIGHGSSTQADGCGLSQAAGPVPHVVFSVWSPGRIVFSIPSGGRMSRPLAFFLRTLTNKGHHHLHHTVVRHVTPQLSAWFVFRQIEYADRLPACVAGRYRVLSGSPDVSGSIRPAWRVWAYQHALATCFKTQIREELDVLLEHSVDAVLARLAARLQVRVIAYEHRLAGGQRERKECDRFQESVY